MFKKSILYDCLDVLLWFPRSIYWLYSMQKGSADPKSVITNMRVYLTCSNEYINAPISLSNCVKHLRKRCNSRCKYTETHSPGIFTLTLLLIILDIYLKRLSNNITTFCKPFRLCFDMWGFSVFFCVDVVYTKPVFEVHKTRIYVHS